jgi:hypothetical protein
MKINRYEGLREEINQIFPDYTSQTESHNRLIETGNHAILPECRDCQDEECLINGPKCPGTRRTAIK